MTTPHLDPLYDPVHRASWGAILAGTVVGLAVFMLLSLLGLAIGFATLDPTETDMVGATPVGSLIWVVLSQLVALFVGGYVGGRLAGGLRLMGAALHGATIWGLSTLLAAWLAVSASMGLMSMAGSAISNAADAMASAADAALPDDLSLPDLSLSQLDMEDLPPALERELRDAGITPDNLGTEAREAFRNVISEAEQSRATNLAQDTAGEIIAQPGTASEEIDDLIDNLFGQGGVLSEEDRQEALAVLERRFDITPEQAEAFLDEVEQGWTEAQEEFQQILDEAQATAATTAEDAAEAVSSAALWAFIASLVGLVAAAAGAALGRPRDMI